MPRSKPVVTLRPPPSSEAMDDFVTGRPDVQTSKRLNLQTSGRSDGPDPSVVTRKDGRQRRRTTVYLPPELVRQLKVFCAQEERELSEVVSAAIERYLTR